MKYFFYDMFLEGKSQQNQCLFFPPTTYKYNCLESNFYISRLLGII